MNHEDITYQNIEESFGMGGPYLGDVYLKGKFNSTSFREVPEWEIYE